jgi:hypothetical protein
VINEEGTNEDATTKEILINKTIPVSNEVMRIVMKIRKAMLNQPKEKQEHTERV